MNTLNRELPTYNTPYPKIGKLPLFARNWGRKELGSENMIKISDPMISSVANKSSVKHNCHLPFSELHISRPAMTKIPVLVIDKLEVRQ